MMSQRLSINMSLTQRQKKHCFTALVWASLTSACISTKSLCLSASVSFSLLRQMTDGDRADQVKSLRITVASVRMLSDVFRICFSVCLSCSKAAKADQACCNMGWDVLYAMGVNVFFNAKTFWFQIPAKARVGEWKCRTNNFYPLGSKVCLLHAQRLPKWDSVLSRPTFFTVAHTEVMKDGIIIILNKWFSFALLINVQPFYSFYNPQYYSCNSGMSF